VFVGTGLGGVYAIGGSDDPVVVPSGGPVASAPAGARTPAPSIGAGPAFEGTWYTDPLTPAQIKAAITAAGYDPATWAPANPDAQTIVYSVALDSGQTHWYEADDGGPRQAEMGGSYVITKPGTLAVDNGNSRFELDYSLAGDVLTLHYDGPSDTLQDPGEQSAGTAFLDAGTFTKHMPATSPAPASSPVTGIPDGRWMTEPIAVGDVVKLIDGAGYDGASEVDGFGATGAATIRFTLDVDSGFMRLGDIVDAHPYTPMTGAYVLTYPKPGVFRIKDNVSTSDIAFQLDGSRLTARFLSDTDTNQDPGELGAATGIFDSAPFAPQR